MFDWTAGTGFVEADGRQLEAAAWGPPPGEAPTIVMLHEGLGCVALWRDFPQKVQEATGWGVFAYSRAGYGRSDPADLPKDAEFMTGEAMDVLPAVLDAAGIGRCVLFGHSDGASISAIYAGGTQDRRVRGLILMAPHFFTEPDGLASIREARTAFETTDLAEKMAKYHNDPRATFYGWAGPWLSAEFPNWNIADAIDYWRVPCLAIQGRDDQYGSLAQLDEIETRTYSPADMLILDDCRHAPHQEKPAEVLAGVAEFVARLQRIEAEEVALG